MDGGSLVLILGDQLSHNIAALKRADKAKDVVLMAEVAEEATYVRHHPKKIAFIFSAMRHFAAELAQVGWQVDYVCIDDERNTGSLSGEIERALEDRDCAQVLLTEPGEWRVENDLKSMADAAGISLVLLEDDRFLCSRRACSRNTSQ